MQLNAKTSFREFDFEHGGARHLLHAVCLWESVLRDEEVFKYLTSIPIDSVEQTSAQAFTNVLWAHRVVDITPPRELRV
jgi:hypothetical protein